jgi:phosphoglycolate phosphatase-like HAD superfamily hydrolase
VLQLSRNCGHARFEAQRESAAEQGIFSISQEEVQTRHRNRQASKGSRVILCLRAIACPVARFILTMLKDCMEFLELHSLTSLFDSIVTMDDAPLKPSPEPIHLAMRQVGGQRAIMFGDTKVFTITFHCH